MFLFDSALYQFLEKSDQTRKATVLDVGKDGTALFSFKFVTVNDFAGENFMNLVYLPRNDFGS